jgi:ABC-type enterochelin transport system permease subunit
MHYRQTQIYLRHQEIELAKAERQFREQPWWDISYVAVLGTMTLSVAFIFGVIGVCCYNDLSTKRTSQASVRRIVIRIMIRIGSVGSSTICAEHCLRPNINDASSFYILIT